MTVCFVVTYRQHTTSKLGSNSIEIQLLSALRGCVVGSRSGDAFWRGWLFDNYRCWLRASLWTSTHESAQHVLHEVALGLIGSDIEVER